MIERGPLFRESEQYVVRKDAAFDLERMLANGPSMALYIAPQDVPLVIPGRDWYEPIEDEL